MQNTLTYIFLFPLLVALIMLFIPAQQQKVFRSLAFAAVAIQLILSIFLAFHFDRDLVSIRRANGLDQLIFWINRIDQNPVLPGCRWDRVTTCGAFKFCALDRGDFFLEYSGESERLFHSLSDSKLKHHWVFHCTGLLLILPLF